ncbi:ubiquitin-specific protease ubp1 [Elasticomyces elasticus]|nr:hypothetical protein LTR28_009760 [Elasticomyces elasticus]KAK4997309.1 ubiquitin-specific protease ubp1 [Elasticomyces elasticus]
MSHQDAYRAILQRQEELRRTPVPPGASFTSTLVYSLVSLCLIYQVVLWLDYFPLLPPLQVLWNAFVYIMPASLVFALDRRWNDIVDASGTAGANNIGSQTHAAKSAALRRLFGLETNGLLKSLPGDTLLHRPSWLTKYGDNDAPPGLGNWDNSCYQNSVIQGLSSLEHLKYFLRQVVPRLSEASTSATLQKTLENLNGTENNGQRLWMPAVLKSMDSWQQQDAQEYFSKIMDELDKDAAKTIALGEKRPGLENAWLLEKTQQDAIGVSKTERRDQMSNAPTEIQPLKDVSNPLEGLLAQRVACMSCGFSEGLSMIPFNCLTVPLGREWNYAMTECLDEYTKLEEISDVECAKCTLLRTNAQLRQILYKPDLAQENTAHSMTSLPPELRTMIWDRLQAVQEALEDDDFTDSTLYKKCQIPKKGRVLSTKSKQAVIARPPKSLVVHFNRSIFDEYTGEQKKNHAEVSYSEELDLRPWCLGDVANEDDPEKGLESWTLDPAKSLLPRQDNTCKRPVPYRLRAVVTHYGRHENGHYICYREHPASSTTASSHDHTVSSGKHDVREAARQSSHWWRLSDEDVLPVSEEDVLRQGGVFMLLYERIEMDKFRVAAPLTLNSTPVAESKLGEAPASFVESLVCDNIQATADKPALLDSIPEAAVVAQPTYTPEPVAHQFTHTNVFSAEERPSTVTSIDGAIKAEEAPAMGQSAVHRKVSTPSSMRTAYSSAGGSMRKDGHFVSGGMMVTAT